MSIVIVDSYKLIEEEVSTVKEVRVRLSTLLYDLSGDTLLTQTFMDKIWEKIEDAQQISFISAYENQITPQSFVGLAMVKWVTPEEDTPGLEVADYCYPLFVAHKNTDNVHISEILENFIYLKAKSQQYMHEAERSIFE